MMTKNKEIILMFLALSITFTLQSQSNNLTGSPYSLFGLGTQSNSNIGKLSGIGRTGIAMESGQHLNISNPAAFATINRNNFLFDVGAYADVSSISNGDNDELRLTSNFASLAIGFKANGKSGFGLTLTPATNTGYVLIGIESSIEGSTDQFVSNINGSGGINDVSVHYAYQFNDALSLGTRFTYFFGTIEETESIIAGQNFLNIEEESFYGGFQFGFGFQYQLNDRYRIGGTLSLPTTLNASKDRIVTKTLDLNPAEVEEDLDINIPDFKWPLQAGVGFNAKLSQSLILNADYKRYFWSSTDQEDNIGGFVDQNVFAVGAEYIPNAGIRKYWQRINYRAGVNYDTGYLEVRDLTIDNLNFTAGLGLPFGRNNMLNISYSRGLRGTTESILVKENTNVININLSLSDLWFIKRKYD